MRLVCYLQQCCSGAFNCIVISVSKENLNGISVDIDTSYAVIHSITLYSFSVSEFSQVNQVSESRLHPAAAGFLPATSNLESKALDHMILK